MGIFNAAASSIDEERRFADELVERYDPYIVALSWKKAPRNVIPPERLADEIDDLAQKIRIQFWQSAQRQTIHYPKAYLGMIAHHEVVNIVRQYHGRVLFYRDEKLDLLAQLSGEELPDPAQLLEEDETI